jgi:UDP-N-acetylglucosamine 2-epimerase (non-hydrolysing)
MKCRIIAVLGTRPEAIKLALVIHASHQRSQEFETAVVHTGQHRTMLDHALQFFKIKPDFDLDVMRPNQTLNSLTGRVLDTVENTCHRFEPNMVLVQAIPPQLLPRRWRLTTARLRWVTSRLGCGAMTFTTRSPKKPTGGWPRCWPRFTCPHGIVPGQPAAEGVAAEKIVVTGNTVIDTLRALSVLPHSWENTPLAGIPDDNSRLVVVTSHRRESWGTDQEHMCTALKDLVQQHPDIRIVYPVHMNPNAHHGEYAAAEHGQNSSDRSTTSRSSACCGVVFWC